MIVAGTGHRPMKLGGYGEDVLARLVGLAEKYLKGERPSEVVSGMAIGWDTALALAALSLSVPLVAAVAFEGQESRWPVEGQRRYERVLASAARVVVVTGGGHADWKFQARNEWMVDHCDRLAALWDGSAGGTANCVSYARRHRPGVAIDNLWDEWRTT
jgi:uncharacterized phage-like protein YoqJ